MGKLFLDTRCCWFLGVAEADPNEIPLDDDDSEAQENGGLPDDVDELESTLKSSVTDPDEIVLCEDEDEDEG